MNGHHDKMDSAGKTLGKLGVCLADRRQCPDFQAQKLLSGCVPTAFFKTTPVSYTQISPKSLLHNVVPFEEAPPSSSLELELGAVPGPELSDGTTSYMLRCKVPAAKTL